MDKNKIVKINVVVIVLFLIIGIVEILLFSQKQKSKNTRNQYQYSTDTVKESDLITYTSDDLAKSHCIDGICIEELVFYYYEDGGGRIEYTIHNQTKEEVSGMIKIHFGEESLIIYYKELNPNEKIRTSSYYQDKIIKEMKDYTLSKLTSEEESKVIVMNK